MSSPAVNIHDDLPPGLKFAPTDEQLIRLYLLPRVRGQADSFPGLIVEDDTAANTQPWELFNRHGRPHDVPAFFYVRTNEVRPIARPDRRCHGGGSWKSQKSSHEDASHMLLVDGKTIRWSRHNLNLNMGSGSVGWVMHEYSITDHPSLKICRISFSGHGQKRKRAPDGYDEDCLAAGEPVPQRTRVTAANNSARSASWTATTSFDGDFGTAHASEDQEPTLDSSDEEIAAIVAEMKMANAPQPNWESQDQMVQKMEQLGTVQLPPASQEPAQLFSAGQEPWMMMPDQELFSDTYITEFVSSLAEKPAYGYPYHYQQFDEQVPTMTMEQQKVDQVAAMVAEMSNAPRANWGEFQEKVQRMEQLGTVQFPSPSQEPAQLFSTGQEPLQLPSLMMMPDQELLSDTYIPEIISSLTETPADGARYHYQQFDEGAVMMPSFCGVQEAHPYMVPTIEPRADQEPSAAQFSGSSSASASWTMLDQDFVGTKHGYEYQEPSIQLPSEEEEMAEMVAELRAAEAPPSMVLTTEPTVDQEPSAAQTSEDEGVAEKIAEMTDTQPQPFVVPATERQVDQEPSTSDGESYMVEGVMTPSSYSVPKEWDMAAETQGEIDWKGFRFCY